MDLLLVPSPLLGPATWAPAAEWLRGHGHGAAVAAHDGRRWHAEELVASVVRTAAQLDPGVVLVAHSNAGLYAPALADRLEVGATVYVDAALPGADADTALAPAGFAAFLADLAGTDGVLPPWTEWWDDVDHLFPDAATRAAVEAEQRRLPLAYFHQRLAVPAGWTARPNAYLGFGDTYADERAFASSLGWPVSRLPGGHLHQLHDPAAVGSEILRLLGELGLRA